MSFINITFFIQAFNFFIAFIFIKYFFFKPALAQIQADDSFQETLINSVKESQLTIVQKNQELQDQLVALKAYFLAQAPFLKKSGPLVMERKPSLIIPEDQKPMLAHIKPLVALVVDKVSHVE